VFFAVDLGVHSSEEVFQVCSISGRFKVHFEDAEEIEEESNVEDCVLRGDLVVEGEERSGHLEGKLIVGEVESGTGGKQMVGDQSVDAVELLLRLPLRLHLVAAVCLLYGFHLSRLFLQHCLLL
jgi:hypothetical protein